MLLYSVQPQVCGKNNQHLLGSGWQPVEADRRQFVQTNFVDGLAITAAHYETDRRHDAGWLRANLFIVDIDEYPDDGTDWTLGRVWADPFVQQYCFAAFPSSSYDESQPKLHLYFQADRLVEDKEQYRAISEYIRGMIAVPSDPALSKPSQAVYGTVFTKINAEKSFGSPLLYYNEGAPLLPTAGIEIDHAAIWDGATVLPRYTTVNSRTISARAKEHETQPPDLQERVTLDALSWALRGWGRKTHEDWKALIMSAFAGSNRASVVRAIMTSDEVTWRPGEREALPAWWNSHEPREKGGYTVATLFMMARANGWLTTTSSEITEAEEFHAEEVGDFLVERMPKRALVLSNTGTGKTLGAIRMLKALGTPRSVFFAPSIKLCINLSTTLTQQGVENTLYIDNGVTRDADTLRDAHVLVTTLQTFGTKLINNGIDVSDYKLAVMDESDDLFFSFVLSGTKTALHLGSHVTQDQARSGMIAVRRVFSEVDHVLMLDGTATRLSVRTAEAFTTQPLKVYRNTFKREKAPVTMYGTLAEAREKFLTSVAAGKKVVYVADTKREARLMELAVYTKGCATEDEVVCITGQTNRDEKVADFFADVEAGASKYRVVLYNSAMGSGVSIVNTKPDVIVQVASFVKPRSNLQMLNRYRRQDEVYVYTPQSENLYNDTYEDSLARIQEATAYEFNLFGISQPHSTGMARTVAELALLAAADYREQVRARGTFYRHLLELDGRQVRDGSGAALDKTMLEEAREALKSFKAEVYADWSTVAPIDRENPPEDDATAIDVAKGLLHAQIKRTVPDYENVDMTSTDLATLVVSFGKYVRTLEHVLDPELLVEQARRDVVDNIASTSRKFYLSRMDLIGLVGLLFEDTTTRLTNEEITQRAPGFIIEVARRKATYDTLVGYKNSFDTLQHRHDAPASLATALAKQILKGLGLKLGKTNGPRIEGELRERITQFSNADDALTLLRLRGTDTDKIVFDPDATKELFAYTQLLGPQLDKMSKEARRSLLDGGEFVL